LLVVAAVALMLAVVVLVDLERELVLLLQQVTHTQLRLVLVALVAQLV